MKYFFVFLMFFSVSTFSQNNDVFKLSTTKAKTTDFAAGWIALDSGWKLKAGDNLDWASPDFDDSSWQTVNLFQDLYNLPQIPKSGIAWFRLKFETDSTLLNQQLAMRIYQTGA